jgi:hypothetical protein
MEGLDELLAPRFTLLRQPQSLNEGLKAKILAATIKHGFCCQSV